MRYPGLTLDNAVPRPNAEVLREYRDYYDRLVGLNPGNQGLAERDAPERQFRWLIELDCGYITEALTGGEDKIPTQQMWENRLGPHNRPHTHVMSRLWPHCPISDRMCEHCRPAGYVKDGCATDHHDEPTPWREITAWGKRVSEHPEEWVDREDGVEGQILLPARAWWQVLLSCGHCSDIGVSAPPDWRPEHGHVYDPERVERAKQNLDKHKDAALSIRSWWESDVRTGCPTPNTETRCYECHFQRRIVAYRPVAVLARPKPLRKPKPEGPPKPPSRATLTRRLNQAEANAARLREQLAQAEAEAEQIRRERDERASGQS
jgi:hypothetical protein